MADTTLQAFLAERLNAVRSLSKAEYDEEMEGRVLVHTGRVLSPPPKPSDVTVEDFCLIVEGAVTDEQVAELVGKHYEGSGRAISSEPVHGTLPVLEGGKHCLSVIFSNYTDHDGLTLRRILVTVFRPE